MAILKIAQMGHPVLRAVCEPVDPSVIRTEAFQGFLDDMLETMDEYDGAGLAAPQVHVPWRVVCLTLDDDEGPEFMINPRIEVLTEDTESMYEGCLSVDGLRGRVHRPNHIRVLFLDRMGEVKGYELSGFPAIVTQHECDHLDGVLFVDRVDTKTLAFLPEYRRYGPLDDLGEESDEDYEDAEFDGILDDLGDMPLDETETEALDESDATAGLEGTDEFIVYKSEVEDESTGVVR